VPFLIAETYLSELVVQDIDTLILGCTHYPLLIPVLEKVVGNGIRIVDSAETTAKYTADLLKELNLLTDNETEGKMENYVTDLPVRFKRVARRFLGREINHVSPVHLS
jgi:glutamate racemase